MAEVIHTCPKCLTTSGVEQVAHGETEINAYTKEYCDDYTCSCCHGRFTTYVTKSYGDVVKIDISYRMENHDVTGQKEHI